MDQVSIWLGTLLTSNKMMVPTSLSESQILKITMRKLFNMYSDFRVFCFSATSIQPFLCASNFSTLL